MQHSSREAGKPAIRQEPMTTITANPGTNDEARNPPASSVPVPPATERDEISLLDILIVVAERKHIVLWVTAVAAVVAMVVSLVVSSSFTATVTLLPPQQNTSMSAVLSSQLGSLGSVAALAGGSLALKNPNDMFVGMLRSRTVEDAMVERFGLMQEYRKRYPSDARKAFESHSSVDGSGKDNLIRISVDDRDAKRSAEMANGYVDQFRILSQRLAITEAAQRRLFFEQELERAKDHLADAEEALKQTEQKTGLIQLDSQARALIETAASLRAQITAREVQIQGMETYATGENAQLVQARRELNSLRAQLAKLGGSGVTGGDEFIVPKGMVPAAGLEYVRKLRDVKYAETIYEMLARQFEIAKLDEAKEGAMIQVVDAAVAPDRRSFPKRTLLVVVSTAVGFFLGVFFALLSSGYERMHENAEVCAKLARLRRMLAIHPRRGSEA